MTQNYTVSQLCLQKGLDIHQLALQSGLDDWRTQAIVLGRWTPSPDERKAIATVFGLGIEDIIWGHVTPVQHIYGQGPA